MRIAWFTPLCKASAIGRFGTTIVAALAKIPGCEVEIWTHQRENLHATAQKVRHFNAKDVSAKDLAKFDYLVYNLGNYLPYHLPIFEISQRQPGVVILHDYCMHHFFAGYYLSHIGSAEKYLAHLEDLYGPEARTKAARGLKGKRPLHEADDVVAYPFWEACLSRAKAIVVHSDFGADLVRARSQLPVTAPSLPHLHYGKLEEGIPAINRGAVGDDGKIHLLSLGHVNPNKRIHVVLEALSKLPELKNAVRYHVIGPMDHQAYKKTLHDLTARYGLESTVEFLGFQPDEVLYEHMCKAHVCVNLRHPVFETGSASLIEAMHFGLPTIVSDTGVYRDMPESCVWRIPLQDECSHLQQALQALITGPARRRQLSNNAREHIRLHCTAKIYAQKLAGLLALLDDDLGVGSRFVARIQQTLLELGEVRGSGTAATIATEVATFWP
jgi:glycosyltransferase involved in cell wall biosynthesis